MHRAWLLLLPVAALLAGCPSGLTDECDRDAECPGSQLCENGVCRDLCEGVRCDEGEECVAGRCRRVGCLDDRCLSPLGELTCYDLPGRCEGGLCVYDLVLGRDCDDRDDCTVNDLCRDGGACAGQPKPCDDPPGPVCQDATTLIVFAGGGECAAGACRYPPVEVVCTDGCEVDHCRNDPCARVSCTDPPDDRCASAGVRRAFDATGACRNGVCDYGYVDTYCPHGCVRGACAGDPCGGVACATPPEDYCLPGGETLRNYVAEGTCRDGECEYPYYDDACANGCRDGACEGCDPEWVDTSACGCTPTACAGCSGTKGQRDGCGHDRDVPCSLAATGCNGTCCAEACCSFAQVCHQDACCTPACQLVPCGDGDGCGGTCEAGSGCTCVPACAGKECGADDGCGAPCLVGSGCTCTPVCAGKECGADDGCGDPCEAGSGCTCVPACAGKECGADDGCGAPCEEGSGCTCTPVCAGKECGADDGCGDPCEEGSGCLPCQPACSGKSCGASDGCGGECRHGSGCTLPCTPWTPGSPDGALLLDAGFDGDVDGITGTGGAVSSVASEGGVSPVAGAGQLKVSRDGGTNGLAHHQRAATTGRVTVHFHDDGLADTAIWVSVWDGSGTAAWNGGASPDGQRHNLALGWRSPDRSGSASPPPADRYFLRADIDYNGREADQTYHDTGVARAAGWHEVEVVVTPEGAYARLDGVSLIDVAVNPRLTSFQSVAVATSDGDDPRYFDELTVAALPDLAAQELAVLDHYVTTYGDADVASLLGCGCDRGPNARTPLLHLAAGYWLRYLQGCDQDGPDSDLGRSIAFLRDGVASHSCWGAEWVSAPFATFLALQAWLVWEALDDELRTAVYEMVLAEAAYFVDDCTAGGEGYVHCPYDSAGSDDSKAEENAWAAAVYALAARMFPDAPDAATWSSRARAAGFHALSTGETYGGYTTATISGTAAAADYRAVCNHAECPNSFYTGATLQLLDTARLVYALSGQPGAHDAQLAHNLSAVLGQYLAAHVDFADYSFVHSAPGNWDLEGAWLYPLAAAGAVTGDPRFDLWERDLVDHKYRSAGEYLYEADTPATVAVLDCADSSAGNALDQARRNGRVQWYWLHGSLLWHLMPELAGVRVP